MTRLSDAMKECGVLVENELDKLIVVPNTPEKKVAEAMRYAVLGGGKRLRPFLLMEVAGLFNVTPTGALRAGAALEMVHCYSLIHDDLPCMDNDDMRRGKPSCHIAFGETMALLAGDALLTRAFDVLADEKTHSDPVVRCQLVIELARAAGMNGMIGGQQLDMMAGDIDMDLVEVTRLQQMKTGRLISFACEAGAIMGKAPYNERQILMAYAKDIGLAFQIADDILDVESSAEVMGKNVRKDVDAAKATFVSFVGVDEAKKQAKTLVEQAVSYLDVFDERADMLRDLARFVVERKS